MWIETPDIAAEAIPGQFITLYTKDADKLLPRPISLCEIDKKNGRLRIVYRIAGAGTKEFSAYKAGDAVEIIGTAWKWLFGNWKKANGNRRWNRYSANAWSGKKP